MPNIRVPVPSLTGGMSTQPDHQRLPDQVADASNAVFDVAVGIRKRAGSQYIERIESLEGAEENLRLHAIDRDPDERYIVIYGDGVLIVRHHDDGEAAVVSVSAEAQAYLDYGNATADDLGLLTIADHTLIWNRLVPTELASAGTYATTTTFLDYDDMAAHTPADATYHAATSDTPEVKAGSWQYDVDGVSFGTWATRVTAGTEYKPDDIWNDAAKNPGGFKIEMRKYNPGLTGGAPGTWTVATLTLTKTGAFTQAEAGDQVKITGGTATAGWYTITSKTSNDAVVLASAINVANQTDIESTAVGGQFACSWTFPVSPKASMVKVAEGIQDALRASGADQACVAWDVTAAPQGKLTITNQWRGDDADILGLSAPASGYDWTAAGRMFVFADGTATSGAGGVPSTAANCSKDVSARWQRVAASGAVGAVPRADTMPVSMRRTRLRTATVATKFEVAPISWGQRLSGSELTNPGVRLLVEGLPIADMALHRDRLWLFGGEYAVASQADDLFDFYFVDASNPADNDPIDLQIGQDSITQIVYAVPFRKTLALFTKGGRQYELSTPEILTPSTAAFTLSTSIDTQAVRPATMSDSLFFLGAIDGGGDSGSGSMFEYVYDDLRVSTMAEPVSAHIPGVIPPDCRTMVGHALTGTVVILPDHEDNDLLVYRTHYQNGRRVQTAWGQWDTKGGWEIRDIAVLAGRLYILTEDGDGRVFLAAQSLDKPSTPATFDFYPHLDQWFTATGVHSLGTTTWTYPSLRQAVQSIVLDDGTILNSASTGWSASTSTVAVTGDYSARTARIGYTFTYSGDFTKPYPRDDRGLADIDDSASVLSLTANLKEAGSLTLSRAHGDVGTRSVVLAENPVLDGPKNLTLWAGGPIEDCRFTWTSTDPRPATITALEWALNQNRRNG